MMMIKGYLISLTSCLRMAVTTLAGESIRARGIKTSRHTAR